jgi:hypothetical protein
MTDVDTAIEHYLTAWNETDPAARRAAIEKTFTADIRYVDPVAVADGRDALDAVITAVQGQFPGFSFSLAGPVDAHHDQARFTWHLGWPGEEPLVIGSDVAVRAPDGRIRTVLGFLDKVPVS